MLIIQIERPHANKAISTPYPSKVDAKKQRGNVLDSDIFDEADLIKKK